MIIKVTNNTVIMPDGSKYRCAVGKGGVGHKHGEGDNITPIGTWPMRKTFYRADKLSAPQTGLAVEVIQKDDIWVDAPNDPHYNTLYKKPYDASYEDMWRDDDVYDIVVPLGYNDEPVIAGKGSAIFMHVAREGYKPTAGCIALTHEDLGIILQQCDHNTLVTIEE